jgi:hypothetical protein
MRVAIGVIAIALLTCGTAAAAEKMKGKELTALLRKARN